MTSSAILALFRVPELRRKVMVTLGLLFVYRIGFQVPIPGINVEKLKQMVESTNIDPLFGMVNMLTGAGLNQCILFSLGVMPYISASIIFSLLVKVIPALEQISKEGAAGQKKISQYTRYATVPICIVQAFFVIFGFLGNRGVELGLINADQMTFGYIMMCLVAFTAGTIFIMWLGEQITEYGIGNGISMIIMGGIIANMPGYIRLFFSKEGMATDEKWKAMALFAICWLATVYVIVYITKAQRRIPIQQAKQTKGRKVYGGQRHFLPIKVNQAGVMPIIFASALLMLPYMLGSALTSVPLIGGFMQGVSDAFGSERGWWYWVVYSLMIFFFAFFWNNLMFQPKEIANNLKEYGSFIPGIRPGQRTAEYLQSAMTRLTLAGSAFLAGVAFLPYLVTRQIDIDPMLAFFMGGTSILIVVGVALDLVDKVNGLLVMRNYDGIMKSDGGSGSWGRKK